MPLTRKNASCSGAASGSSESKEGVVGGHEVPPLLTDCLSVPRYRGEQEQTVSEAQFASGYHRALTWEKSRLWSWKKANNQGIGIPAPPGAGAVSEPGPVGGRR